MAGIFSQPTGTFLQMSVVSLENPVISSTSDPMRANAQPTDSRDTGFLLLSKFIFVFGKLKHPLFLMTMTNALALAYGLLAGRLIPSTGSILPEIILLVAWSAFLFPLLWVAYYHRKFPFRRSSGLCMNLFEFLGWIFVYAVGFITAIVILAVLYDMLTASTALHVLRVFWPFPPYFLPLAFSLLCEFTYLARVSHNLEPTSQGPYQA